MNNLFKVAVAMVFGVCIAETIKTIHERKVNKENNDEDIEELEEE